MTHHWAFGPHALFVTGEWLLALSVAVFIIAALDSIRSNHNHDQ